MKLDVQDFENGTPVKFIVWKANPDGSDVLIKEIDEKISGNKSETILEYTHEEVKRDLGASTEEVKGEPEYYFSVDIEGEEAKSEALKFTFPIEIYLDDSEGKPLDNVAYTITLSDGTKKKGKFKNGTAKVDDAPYGKFTLVVDGYDFVFRS